MIPPSFDYHCPKTVSEAIELLTKFGDEAKILAGKLQAIQDVENRYEQVAINMLLRESRIIRRDIVDKLYIELDVLTIDEINEVQDKLFSYVLDKKSVFDTLLDISIYMIYDNIILKDININFFIIFE